MTKHCWAQLMQVQAMVLDIVDEVDEQLEALQAKHGVRKEHPPSPTLPLERNLLVRSSRQTPPTLDRRHERSFSFIGKATRAIWQGELSPDIDQVGREDTRTHIPSCDNTSRSIESGRKEDNDFDKELRLMKDTEDKLESLVKYWKNRGEREDPVKPSEKMLQHHLDSRDSYVPPASPASRHSDNMVQGGKGVSENIHSRIPYLVMIQA